MRRWMIGAAMVLAAIQAGVSTTSAQAGVAASTCAARGAAVPLLCEIHYWRNHVWRLESRMGASITPYNRTAERSTSDAYRRWVRHRWYSRWLTWRGRYTAHAARPWSSAWFSDVMCVHSFEGAWNDETGNGYNGGLQMDYTFETTYGPEFYARWGDAGHWPPIDQIIAAWRAYQSRGWTPWPNTAADCGLL